ncbi:MAG: pyruvate formate lyase family protein, partial [Victivallales bacterium]|nr:pyruvate formate lyase family protein [Victivallales bacterium]
HFCAAQEFERNKCDKLLMVKESLEALMTREPRNLHEALHFIYLFFMFGEHIDRVQVRTLGNLDKILFKFYQDDLAAGTLSEAQVRELLACFILQWSSINNYWGHPFYLGGTRENGETQVNELTFLILDVYDKLNIHTPKIQIKLNYNTPEPLINKALDMIRRHRSSIVFVGEPAIAQVMSEWGLSPEDARTANITGCYEFVPKGRANTTQAGHVNMLKPFETIFHDGTDPASGLQCSCRCKRKLENIITFEQYYDEYLHQLDFITDTVIKCVNEFEQYLDRINPANVFSATIQSSLQWARDAFFNGCEYNLSSIVQVGFASAVDALLMIKEYVYERREVSLAELKDILDSNWRGAEKLRLKILNNGKKFGNGIDEADRLAGRLAEHLAAKVNMRPNGRNGFCLNSSHPALMFVRLGRLTGATPDGRCAGEEMSKNISPAVGTDRRGVTALLKSAASIDVKLFPGDCALDVMLHQETVKGEEGLDAMRTLLDYYLKHCGHAIQFNIFDAETLIAAQKEPEKYADLQVRICGWNVRFNTLDKQEQAAYIRRAQEISG